jgi:hypothetical protein
MNQNIKISVSICVFFLCAVHFAFAQTNTAMDTIQVIEKYNGATFHQKGSRLHHAELDEILYTDKEAYAIFNKANTNRGFSKVLNLVGGLIVGYGVTNAVITGNVNFMTLGIGTGCVIIAIPLADIYKRKATKAVSIYNRNLRKG